MGSLEAMGASVYSINETKWDTTCPTFCKYIKQTIKKKDQYAKVAFSSNEEEIFDGNWKPGGNLLGVSGVWASRVEKSGTDPLGRWSWAVLRGKQGKQIMTISAYRISQTNPNQAGPLTSCQQQVRILQRRGVIHPNPKKIMLQDFSTMLQTWRNKNAHNEVVLMMDSNEDITDEGAFAMFAQNNDLIDIATQFDPLLAQSPTYLHSSKRLDYILLSPHLAELAIKAGHHQFHQHVVSYHKGVYVHFRREDLFDTDTMDRSQLAYRRLRLCRRDIVEKYIAKLEQLFEEHHLLPRAEGLASQILSLKDHVVLQSCMETFDKLDKERTAYMIAAEKFAGRPPPPPGVYE
jgi:hypothetical protein